MMVGAKIPYHTLWVDLYRRRQLYAWNANPHNQNPGRRAEITIDILPWGRQQPYVRFFDHMTTFSAIERWTKTPRVFE